jgi:hypothetical protein
MAAVNVGLKSLDVKFLNQLNSLYLKTKEDLDSLTKGRRQMAASIFKSFVIAGSLPGLLAVQIRFFMSLWGLACTEKRSPSGGNPGR